MASQTNVKVLSQGTQLATSVGTLYSAPANTTTLVKKVTVTNTSGAVVTVTVYKVASGGTAGAANTITSARSIPAGATVELYEAENHALAPGDTIQALASAATSVSFSASGIEIV